MKITKENLDTPFCELFADYTNTETPRKFIRNSEYEFEIQSADLDRMSDEELNEYIELLDYLWTK